MSKIMKKQNKDYLFIGFGCVIILISMIPCLILGENSVIFCNDQLDGEVIGYILHAKYLFTGITQYPEVMNGISANGLFPPAPFMVLLYRFLSPLWAFLVNQTFCMLVGYISMYYSIRQFILNRYICFFSSILFAFLPLFSVYGLCQYGIPLVFMAFYQLYQKKNKIFSLLLLFLYAGMSSLVLIGYAILGFTGIFIIYLVIRKQYDRLKPVLGGWLTLLVTYLITNHSLLMQILKIGEQIPSHKEELLRNGQNCLEAFLDVFYRGTLHTPSHQQIIVWFSVLTIVYTLIRKNRNIMLYLLFLFNVFCALFYSFYQSPMIASLRNQIGGILKDFQADRVFWLTVPVWYFILALCLNIFFSKCHRLWANKQYLALFPCLIILTVSVIGCSATVYYYSDLNKNIHRMQLGENYEKITWNDFYAPDVYEQLDQFIGRDKSSYRVISLGIHPATAIFNGFYCLDGYSNNYDLNYKHAFRKIIESELDKEEALRQYYDNWGCRCYILSSELGINNNIVSKHSSIQLQNLAINTEAAKDMGAEYLFSALPIKDADEIGLKLLREEPFVTDTSYIEVYLYQIQ